MRNLDPVLIERANQVSFSGGGGNLVNREYLNAVSRFSSRFPETDDLEENQHLFLRARLEGWQELVYTAYSDRLRRRAEFVSWMVAGRSNYNFKKAQKQLDAERRAEESFAAKMTAYLDHTANQLARLVSPARQIEAYANGCDDPIASGDPLALEKLEARLDYLTAAQERMKRVNAWYRGHGTALGCPDLSASAALKIDDVLAEEVARGCKSPVPFEPWALRNNAANITRLRDRMDDLSNLKAARENQKNSASEFENLRGLEVVENVETMRLQLLFEAVPSAEVRALLKQNGFRYAPSCHAWQRQLTDNARRALSSLLPQLDSMLKEE